MLFAASLFPLLAVAGIGQAAPSRRQVNQGAATFYAPGLGACGQVNSATDHIVALAAATFDSFAGGVANPNANPVCGRQITINFQGQTTTATVVDRCPGCAGPTDVDLSPAAFDDLASEDLGRIQVTWSFD